MKSALYVGQVYHKRLRPREHVLRYRVFSLLLALDEIDALSEKLWLFSRNRWNLFSFYDRDFGESYNESLAEYTARHLRAAGIDETPQRVLLSCYPRVCGYTFNPLSLFYCLDENERMFAILHEVHNTFGERHVYTLPVRATEQADSHWINQTTQKALFVSPFAHMDMHYTFRLNVPDEQQVLSIRVHDELGHLLSASYRADRQSLCTPTLVSCFCRLPFMTVKVMLGIHWEALRLWVKKVPLFAHQSKQSISDNNYKNPS